MVLQEGCVGSYRSILAMHVFLVCPNFVASSELRAALSCRAGELAAVPLLLSFEAVMITLHAMLSS
jgi:hypothetical protein